MELTPVNKIYMRISFPSTSIPIINASDVDNKPLCDIGDAKCFTGHRRRSPTGTKGEFLIA